MPSLMRIIRARSFQTCMHFPKVLRNNFCTDKFLFVGAKGNIGGAWQEAAQVMGFELAQCCPKSYELDGVEGASGI